MRNLFASTGNVMGAGGGAGGGGGSSSGGAAPAPVEYDVPIGEYVGRTGGNGELPARRAMARYAWE